MMRVLTHCFLLCLLSLGLSACGGSDNDSAPAVQTPASINTNISPANLTLDTPPTDGKLPNDLVPPV